MKTYYNTLTIVSINIFDVSELPWYRYINEKRFLGFIIKKEGFYDDIFDCYVKKSDIEKQKKLFIDGQTVMIKPHVTVQYANDEEHTTYHDTYEEAIKFAEHIKNYYDKYLDLDDISIKESNLKNKEKHNNYIIEEDKSYVLDLGALAPIEVKVLELLDTGVKCEYLYSNKIETIDYELFEMNGLKKNKNIN